MKPVRFALVGVAGIGGYHWECMQRMPEIKLVAAAEKYPERDYVKPQVEKLERLGIPIYNDYREMLDKVKVEAISIATPHHWHAPIAIDAMYKGLHVFVEKPPATTIQDAVEMERTSQITGRLVGIDFQYTSLPSTLKLKKLLRDDRLGRIRNVVGVMEWMRKDSYYTRTDWSGKKFADGLPCWDGVMNNQGVHLINQCLLFASRSAGNAKPEAVTAELYRIHVPMETEDLAALRIESRSGAEVYFYVTTCCDKDYTPTIDVIGEKGKARWVGESLTVEIEGEDPITFDGQSDRDDMHRNFALAIRDGRRIYAPLHEGIKTTYAISRAYESAGGIKKLEWDQVSNLKEIIDQAAEKKCLLSELDQVSWAQPGRRVLP